MGILQRLINKNLLNRYEDPTEPLHIIELNDMSPCIIIMISGILSSICLLIIEIIGFKIRNHSQSRDRQKAYKVSAK